MKTTLLTVLFAGACAAPLASQAADAANGAQPEIVVTAQKRSERLQDVPVAITAISGNTLKSAQVTDLRSLVSLTPALRMDQTGIFTQPTIRGVGSAVTGPGAASNVSLYVDGFYQPSQAGNDFDLSNVTQVEVLKGPQGTLFGRNATGGAILITTADPSFTPKGDLSASYRSFNDVRGELYLSGPITSTLAANIAVYGRKSDGFKKDIVTGKHDAPDDTVDVRAKLLFKPTDQISFTLTYQHTDIIDPGGAAYTTYDGNSIGNAIAGVVSAINRFNTAMPSPPENRIISDAVYLKSQFAWDWAKLTSYTSYHSETDKEQSQLDRTSADIFTATWRQSEKTFSEEVNLGSTKSGPLSWVTGVFYYHDKAGYPYFLFNGFNAGGAAYVTTNAYALYADATYELLPKLFLTGGIRYSNEKQEFTWNAPLAGMGDTSHTWDKVNERAILRYEFAPNTSVYASYSNGFKSGAYNTLTFSKTPVNPESINAWEVGLKTQQHNLRFDTSAFYYNYSNLQFTAYKFDAATNATVSELLNAAKARIYGIDAQMSYNFTPDFDVRLGGAWTHTRYLSFPGSINYTPNVLTVGGQTVLAGNSQSEVDASGKTLIRAPDFTLTAGANYTTPLPSGKLKLSANLYYSSRVYFDPNNNVSQSAYATLDLRASWVLPGDKVSVSVFGNNVTDTKYVTQVAEDAFGYGGVYGTPAVVGVAFDAKF